VGESWVGGGRGAGGLGVGLISKIQQTRILLLDKIS